MTRFVFLGNCQAGAICQIFITYVAPHTGDVGTDVADYEEPTTAVFDRIDGCDALVRILMEPDQVTPFHGRISFKHSYLVPFVTAAWLWPKHGTLHPDRDRLRFSLASMIDCSDGFLNRLISAGCDPQEAAKRYLGLDASGFAGLDRRYELLMKKQRERDNLTVFASADFIERGFRNDHMFSTPFHPTLKLSKYIAITCFEQIGVPRNVIDVVNEFMDDSFYPKLEVPIHPFVAGHFGLKFVAQDRQYQWFNAGKIAFHGYIETYMAWDTNDELEEGFELAASGDGRAAIKKLKTGLEASPDSAEGY